MEKTLKKINSLIQEGIIADFAIGGGIACFYYIEPSVTYDLDVMIILTGKENTFTPLENIYNWARQNEYPEKEEHIIIESIPVQFLPVYNNLVHEAVFNSKRVTLFNTETKIIGPEYLIAIMLDTNRAKDRQRVIQMFEEAEIDLNLLNKILSDYNLNSRFESLNINPQNE